MLADTAWELFHRLNAVDARRYLQARASQGFTSVFAVAVSEFGGLDTPNANGHVPFFDRDPEAPDERYWAHVDMIVHHANALGITVGMLPCWGGYWADEGEIFATPDRAKSYATWIANRYSSAELIWVLGGDRFIDNQRQRDCVNAFSAGIRSVVDADQTITFHPRESSFDDIGDASWADFHLVQSGHHGWAPPNYQLVEQLTGPDATRPVLDGEPNYEGHPVMDPDWKPVPGWEFTAADARRALYHAVFAGAAGHVYGADGIYQMGTGQPDPVTGSSHSWQEALEFPGARQVSLGVTFLQELKFETWRPSQRTLARGLGYRSGHARAMARSDDSAVLVYAPWGRSVQLNLDSVEITAPVYRWWCPRSGRWEPPAQYSGGAVPHPYSDDDGLLLVTSSTESVDA